MRDFHIKAQVREGDGVVKRGKKRGNVKEREWGEGGRRGEGGWCADETDIHSKRILALVILSLFCASRFSLCVSVLSVSI